MESIAVEKPNTRLISPAIASISSALKSPTGEIRMICSGLARFKGSGFRVQKVQGSGFRVQGSKVQGSLITSGWFLFLNPEPGTGNLGTIILYEGHAA